MADESGGWVDGEWEFIAGTAHGVAARPTGSPLDAASQRFGLLMVDVAAAQLAAVIAEKQWRSSENPSD